MIIAVTSDLHFGHRNKTIKRLEKFFENLFCENPDIIVIAGDLISDKQSQMPKLFRLLRKWFISTPILVVFGNHDFYNNVSVGHTKFHGALSYENIRVKQRDWLKEYNISYLSDAPYIFDDIVFFGFDGYYNQIPPKTNDPKYMPRFAKSELIHNYLNQKAFEKLNEILLEVKFKKYVGKKKICVTHFPPYSKQSYYWFMAANISFLDPITENFDYLVVGHSHLREDWEHNDCRIINPGSDYDVPRFTLI